MNKIALVSGIFVVSLAIIIISFAFYRVTDSEIFQYIIIAVFLFLAISVNMIILSPRASQDKTENMDGHAEIKKRNIAVIFTVYYVLSFLMVLIVLLVRSSVFGDGDFSPTSIVKYMQQSAVYSIPLSIIILLLSIFSRN